MRFLRKRKKESTAVELKNPQNNLENITPRNVIYRQKIRQLRRVLAREFKDDPEALAIFDNLPQAQYVAADNYFLHYSTVPILRGENPDPIMGEVLKIYHDYTGTKEYKRLKTITTLDPVLSMFHTTRLTKRLVEVIKKKLKEQQQNNPMLQNLPLSQLLQLAMSAAGGQGQGNQQQPQPGQPQPGEGGQDRQQESQESTAVDTQQQSELAEAARQAVAEALKESLNKKEIKKALKKADKDTEIAKKISGEMGGGHSAGKEFTKLVERLTRMIETLGVQNIEAIFSYADQITWDLRYTKKKKKPAPWGELGGYRITRNPMQALPRELAVPEELFLKKLVNGFLAKQKVATPKGAYYILLDISGSMDTREKTIWSRSVALALAKLAKVKGYKYYLRLFTTDILPSEDQPPLSEHDKVVEILIKQEPYDGTNIDNALRVALKDLKESKVETSTIILITDGEDWVKTSPQQLKDANAALIAVMIHGHNDTLEQLAEESGGEYMTAKLDQSGALKLIRKAEAMS